LTVGSPKGKGSLSISEFGCRARHLAAAHFHPPSFKKSPFLIGMIVSESEISGRLPEISKKMLDKIKKNVIIFQV
jgi:hypothetical protein